MAYPYPAPVQYQQYQPQVQPVFYGTPMPDQLTQLRQMPQQMQMPQQNMQVQQVQQPDNSGIIWVQGIEGAKAYMVAPGNTVQLWDSECQSIYLKSVDASGMPSMRIYDYVERGQNTPKNAPERPQEPQIDLSNYITREQLDDILAERFKRISGNFKADRRKEDED